jgi:hypothetical protein
VRYLPCVSLLCVLMTTQVVAAELAPFAVGDHMGIFISGLRFPDTLETDLQSGLTSRIVLRLVLLLGSRPIAQESLQVAVKFDLWDEKFRVTVTAANELQKVAAFTRLSDIDAWLAQLRLETLFLLRDLPPGKYQLRANLLLNPVEKERVDQLKRWIAENSTPAGRLHPGSADPSAPLSGSRPSEMFNSILELYMKGEDVVAPWHAELSSAQFTPDELDHAEH